MSDGPKDKLFERTERQGDDRLTVLVDNGYGDDMQRRWLGPDSLTHRTIVVKLTIRAIDIVTECIPCAAGESSPAALSGDARWIRIPACRQYSLKLGTTPEETDVLPVNRMVDCFGCMH